MAFVVLRPLIELTNDDDDDHSCHNTHPGLS